MNIYDIYRDLKSNRKKKIILDTDTFNEVDDQFALAYAMCSTERIDLMSVNAAPFLNKKVATPQEGMEKSFEEIKRVMTQVDPNRQIPVYRGSTSFLLNRETGIESEAVDQMIRSVLTSVPEGGLL